MPRLPSSRLAVNGCDSSCRVKNRGARSTDRRLPPSLPPSLFVTSRKRASERSNELAFRFSYTITTTRTTAKAWYIRKRCIPTVNAPKYENPQQIVTTTANFSGPRRPRNLTDKAYYSTQETEYIYISGERRVCGLPTQIFSERRELPGHAYAYATQRNLQATHIGIDWRIISR